MLKLLADSTQTRDPFWKRSGKTGATWTHDFYPDTVMRRLRLRTVFSPQGDGPLCLDLPPFYLCIDDACHTTAISRTIGPNRIAHSDQLRLKRGRENVVDVTCGGGKISLVVNGKKLSFHSDYQPTIDQVSLYWPAPCAIQQLELWGEADPAAARPCRADDYQWSMTIDLLDDLLPAPYTRRMLKELLKRHVALGIRRVYWLDHGGRDSGFWDPTGNRFANDAHIRKTFASLGKNPLKTVVELGHQLGLEVYALIKPFDMSIMGYNFPTGSDLARKYGKNELLGGKAYACFNFAAEHPELCLQRRRLPPKRTAAIATLELSSKEPVELSETITLWVSDDNWKYRPYPAPYRCQRGPGKITLSGLAIREKFLAVKVSAAATGASRFYHSLAQLVKVFDAKGHPVEFTYGLMPRSYPQYPEDGEYLGQAEQLGGRFEEDGFFFDSFTYCVPTSALSGEALEHVSVALDNPHGVIGLAVGKNKIVPGVMCPSEAKARNYWLGLIQEALATGVDGIDLRQMGHHNIIEWKEYGFNRPAVREFKRRYGVDVRRQAFDWEAWRRLRGDYYTRFLEEAKTVIHASHKKLQLHLEDLMEGTPDGSTLREIHWDWETWLERGIPDEVTLKALNLHAFRTHFGREVIRRCREKGIPVQFCTFIHRHGILGLKNWKEFLARQVRDSGLTGFNVYENAELIISQQNGRLKIVQPELWDYLQRLAATR